MSGKLLHTEAYFQLCHKPFTDWMDSQLLFGCPVIKTAFDSLYLHVLERKGLALLLGEPGIGKTALLKRLRDQFFVSDRVVCPGAYPRLLTAHPGLSIDSLMLLISAGGRGADTHRTADERLRALAGDLAAQAQRGVTTALLIDEAQTLTEAVLADLHLLTALRDGEHLLLQIILAGTAALEGRLEPAGCHPVARHIATRVRLGRLDRRDVGPYIEHHLRIAGHLGGGLFTPEAVERITACSEGVPSRINQIARAALHIACAQSSATVSAEAVDQAVAEGAWGGAAPADRPPGRQGQTATIEPVRQTGPSVSAWPLRPAAEQQRWEQTDALIQRAMTEPLTERSVRSPDTFAYARRLAVAILAVVCVTVSAAIAAYWGTSEPQAELQPGQLTSSTGIDLSGETPKEPARPLPRLDEVTIGAPSPRPGAAQAPIAGPAGIPDLPLSEDGLTGAQGQKPGLAGSTPARGERDSEISPEISIATSTSMVPPPPAAPAAQAPAADNTMGDAVTTPGIPVQAATAGEMPAAGAPTGSATPSIAVAPPSPPSKAAGMAETAPRPSESLAERIDAPEPPAERMATPADGTMVPEASQTEVPPPVDTLPSAQTKAEASPPVETPPLVETGALQSASTSPSSGTLEGAAPPPETAMPAAALTTPPAASAEAGAASALSGGQAPVAPGAVPATGQAAVVPRPTASSEASLMLQQVIARGDALLSTGDVISARLFYELAASRGSAAAAAMVGKTYDPLYLSQANIRGAQADPAKAADWYRKAIEAGASDAAILLQSINERLR